MLRHSLTHTAYLISFLRKDAYSAFAASKVQKRLKAELRLPTWFSRGETRLQKLGRITNVSPSGNAIVKANNTPQIGSQVVDENLTVIGRIFDVIGPVSAPYAVIKPSVREPAKLQNKQVYLLLSKTKRSKRDNDQK